MSSVHPINGQKQQPDDRRASLASSNSNGTLNGSNNGGFNDSTQGLVIPVPKGGQKLFLPALTAAPGKGSPEPMNFVLPTGKQRSEGQLEEGGEKKKKVKTITKIGHFSSPLIAHSIFIFIL